MTYEQYLKLPEQVQEWARKIAEADSRPAHPEDYVGMAKQILKAGKPDAQFRRVMVLREDEASHTEMTYSFLDFWELIIGRPWRDE